MGGTGAAFSTLPLGCGREKAEKNLRQTAPDRPASILSRQRYAAAHKYIRDTVNGIVKGPVRTVHCDVLIIGAGASGIAAAQYLKSRGVDIRIVENESVPGGAGIRGSWQGVEYPFGSVYFVTYDGQIKELCDAAGVEPMHAPDDAVFYKGQLLTEIWQDKQLAALPVSAADKEGMRRFRDYLLKPENIPSYPLPARLNPKLAALDAMSGRSFIRQFNSPFLESLLNLYSRSSMGAGLDETNAYCLLNFYRWELGDAFDAPRYIFKGGMNGLLSALSHKIGHEKFMFEHLAYSVSNVAKGVSTLCVAGAGELVEIRSKYAILASQKHVAARILPELSQSQADAMKQLRYPPYCTIHLHSDEPLLPKGYLDIWTPGAEDFCTDIICPNALLKDSEQNGKFVYSVYLPMADINRKMLLDNQQLAAFAYSVAEKTCALLRPGSFGAIQEIECYAWGHSLVVPSPGSHNGIAQRAMQPIGRIFPAGSDNDASPGLETAVYHGFKCAEMAWKALRH